MVRNRKGGSGHKKMARKNVAPKGDIQVKTPSSKEEGEIIACDGNKWWRSRSY